MYMHVAYYAYLSVLPDLSCYHLLELFFCCHLVRATILEIKIEIDNMTEVNANTSPRSSFPLSIGKCLACEILIDVLQVSYNIHTYVRIYTHTPIIICMCAYCVEFVVGQCP